MSDSTSTEAFELLRKLNLEENTLNGLQIGNLYVPEEIILNIFTYLSPSDILESSLVCKRWFNIARSNALWHDIYNIKEYPKKAKNLPWYVFYSYFATNNFRNLIKNGNGEDGFKHWTIFRNGGKKCRVEQTPVGCDPLPIGIPEFRGHKCCFATTYMPHFKGQSIDLKRKNLLKHIIKKYKPALYASEWFAGHYAAESFYRLIMKCDPNVDLQWPIDLEYHNHITEGRVLQSDPNIYTKSVAKRISQSAGKTWEKAEILAKDYPDDMKIIYFRHQGVDLQLSNGHHGSKMAGGVLRFDFDSILPTEFEVVGRKEENTST